jgi:hypothetical protein
MFSKVIDELSSQDKIWMEHWVPLHPGLESDLKALVNQRNEDDPLFNFNLVQLWLKRNPITLKRCNGRFTASDP